MLRLLTAPPPRLSVYQTLLCAVPTRWDRVPAPVTARPQLESQLHNRGKPQNCRLRPVLVWFVKVLNLPTVPSPPQPTPGGPGRAPPTPAPVTEACGLVTPARVRGSHAFCPPCDMACTVRFCLWGVYCLSEVRLVLFSDLWVCCSEFGLVFPFSLAFIYSCFPSRSY